MAIIDIKEKYIELFNRSFLRKNRDTQRITMNFEVEQTTGIEPA